MSQSKLPPSSANLCERCKQMTTTLPGLRALASKEGYQHDLIGELQRSADCGCPMCVGLRNSHKYHMSSRYTKPYIRIFSRVHLLTKFDAESDNIQFESVGHPFEMAKLIEMRSTVWDDKIDGETEHFRLPKVSSLSIFTCAGDPAEKFLQPQEKAEYLALSYRWGGPQEIATTIATLPKWRLGIPVAALPLTLQNAIAVTRHLGFRYLWVDALCIIQDDAADKAAEINQMVTIYKNSTLAIAAASTASVQESFLSPKPIPATWSVPYLLPSGAFGNLWIRADHTNVILSPLDTRAWALQESLLSPRVLWYGPTGLKWKCQTTEFRDVHETVVTYWTYSGRKHNRLPSSIFGIAEPASPYLRNQQSAIWKKVVEDCSGRDITFREDRLPALAGIASELQKLWRDDYVAGMWRSCLIKHLAWRSTTKDVSPSIEDNLSSLHLPLAYQSPGWSWISFKGEVDILDVFYEHAQVVECNVTLVDSTAPMSRVRDGRLVLKAAWVGEEQRLKTNSEDCWFKWDYNQCGEQKDISRDFRYALLGYKEQQPHQMDSGEREGIALFLASVADGTFMRIGMVFGFSTKDWTIEALERQIIAII